MLMHLHFFQFESDDLSACLWTRPVWECGATAESACDPPWPPHL